MNIQTRVGNKVVELNNYQGKYFFALIPGPGKTTSLTILQVLSDGRQKTDVLIEKSKNWVALEGYLKGILAIMPYKGI